MLTQNSSDNPDGLFELLFCLYQLKKDIINKKYGLIVQKVKQHNMLNGGVFNIVFHNDKEELNEKFELCVELLNSDKSIKDVLMQLRDNDILYKDKIESYLFHEDYSSLIEVSVCELVNLIDYLDDPRVSTQHGVKGESHNSVVFVAENSGNPSVKIYEFLKLWTEINISLNEFEKSYFSIIRGLEQLYDKFDLKSNRDLSSVFYQDNKGGLESEIDEWSNNNKDSEYFNHIYKPLINNYYASPGVTRLRNCININSIYGVYVAYKLFYVGCSRARKNLVVILKRTSTDSYYEKLVEKLKSVGFSIENDNLAEKATLQL